MRKLLCVLVLVVGCDTQEEIAYRVSGTQSETHVSWIDEDGLVELDAPLPFTKNVSLARGDRAVVQGSTRDVEIQTIRCEVLQAGRVLAAEEQTGRFAIATCGATVE